MLLKRNTRAYSTTKQYGALDKLILYIHLVKKGGDYEKNIIYCGIAQQLF